MQTGLHIIIRRLNVSAASAKFRAPQTPVTHFDAHINCDFPPSGLDTGGGQGDLRHALDGAGLQGRHHTQNVLRPHRGERLL